ncbi:hypothetical protein DXG01_000428 [Tephrocybe rancida]|nr:hypothetical protein DXG01_000428 [Tephrocybe rancida]
MDLLISVLHVLFVNIHDLLVLFIPLYYASQAASILNSVKLLASNSVTGHIDNEGQEPIAESAIEQLDMEDDGHERGATAASRLSLSLPSHARSSTPLARVFEEEIESLWPTFIEHLCKGWLILLTTATTLLIGSAPLLHLPGTNEDPVVRGFVYLFLFRFLAVVPSALTLLYYFYKTQWRSYACYKEIFFRGLIFIILALFLSLWRGGFSNAPSMVDTHPLTSMAFRIIITAMLLADVAWIFWLIVNLKVFEAKTKGVPLAAPPADART